MGEASEQATKYQGPSCWGSRPAGTDAVARHGVGGSSARAPETAATACCCVSHCHAEQCGAAPEGLQPVARCRSRQVPQPGLGIELQHFVVIRYIRAQRNVPAMLCPLLPAATHRHPPPPHPTQPGVQEAPECGMRSCIE